MKRKDFLKGLGLLSGGVILSKIATPIRAEAQVTDNNNKESYTQGEVDSKLDTKSDSNHTHDDRYYTEEESDTKLSEKLDTNGDTKSTKTTFTSSDNVSVFNSGNLGGQSKYSWNAVAKVSSGETHGSLFNKISIMFKNIRTIAKLIGTTDISNIGNGTITGGLSTINSNLTDKTTWVYLGADSGTNIEGYNEIYVIWRHIGSPNVGYVWNILVNSTSYDTPIYQGYYANTGQNRASVYISSASKTLLAGSFILDDVDVTTDTVLRIFGKK